MFQSEAAAATAALQRATRTARRAAQAERGTDGPAPPRPVDWETLSASVWKRHGALSAFRMKGTGTIYFTAGRDVVREATVDGTTTTLVQLMEIAEDAIIQLPVQ
eukprot:1227320-Pleurochrysis_carterae.AAC.1